CSGETITWNGVGEIAGTSVECHARCGQTGLSRRRPRKTSSPGPSKGSRACLFRRRGLLGGGGLLSGGLLGHLLVVLGHLLLAGHLLPSHLGGTHLGAARGGSRRRSARRSRRRGRRGEGHPCGQEAGCGGQAKSADERLHWYSPSFVCSVVVRTVL